MADSGPTAAEMGLTPKDMGIKTPPAPQEIHIEVDDQKFNQMLTRIEKSGRIKQDIRPGGGKPYSKARVKEIRDLEQRVNLRERKPENIDEDMHLDGRGFQQQSYWVSYKSPDGKILKERVVIFAKQGKNGQWEFMKDSKGRTMAINGDLYDSRLTSNIHAQGMDYNTYTIPRVDGRGAYTGIITLRIDKNQPAATEQATIAASQTTQLESTTPPKEDPLLPVRSILDKLKTPGQSAAEPMRLGKEVVLETTEMDALEKVIDKATAQLTANTGLTDLQNLIQQQSNDKAFGIAMFFGGAVVEDDRMTSPQVVIEQGGPKIHVPSELFRVWKAFNNLNDAKSLLKEYRNQGYRGKPAAFLAELIEKGVIPNP